MDDPFFNYPKIIVLDLDGTVWAPEMYQLWGGGSPFKPCANGNVTDRKGEEVKILKDLRSILKFFFQEPPQEAWKNVKIAAASTCDEPEWGRECMAKMKVNKQYLIDLFDEVRKLS